MPKCNRKSNPSVWPRLLIATKRATTAFEKFPTEFSWDIMKHLSAEDLGSFRLVAKRFAKDGPYKTK